MAGRQWVNQSNKHKQTSFQSFFFFNHIDSIFIKEIYCICRKHELLPPVVLFQSFQVSLQLDSYGEGYFSHICGGSILNSYHIMTAAHCILRSDYPSAFNSSHFLSLFIASDCTEQSFLCVFPAYVLTWCESVLSPSVQILVSIEWWQVSIIWKSMKAVSRSSVWKRSLSILAGRVTLGSGIVAANEVTFLINSQF